MPSNVEIKDHSKDQNPMLGLIGFIVLIIVGGFSFLISGPFTRYLTTAHVVVGAGIQLLPISFPATWSPLAGQLAVAFAVFLFLFVFIMIILFLFMKPSSQSETSVSIDVLRREVAAKKKGR